MGAQVALNSKTRYGGSWFLVLVFPLTFTMALAPFSLGQSQAHKPSSSNEPRNESRGTSSPAQKKPPSRQAYAGDNACRSCHQKQAESYAGTAHHLTSQLPSGHSIAGNFSAGFDTLKTSNPYLHFAMSATKDGYFESAVEELAPGKTMSRTERIDLVIGSGRKGQTYLYWKGDRLFELPVSYWTELGSWINSPGYPEGSPRFDAPVIPRCLECHAGFFESFPEPRNRFTRGSLVPGITCERCHGPGREHVVRYSSKPAPAPGTSKGIINPVSLPRERQIDVCAECHSGVGASIAPALSFVPGEALDDYLYIPYSATDAPVDVHGSQVQLLSRSRCYKSTTMTCTTCHDVHKPQRDAASFSQQCLTCHKAEDCGTYPKRGREIANNCVDCHMPLQESEKLFSDTNGKRLKPRVRNHKIGIYQEAKLP